MTQWHPIFDQLLRTVLQEYYEVQTNVPVGDLPREADIVLVRRASKAKPPFRTLWRHLSPWNVLELKGRSESARVNDVDFLVEVGLGIHRRLQEQETAVKISRADVSFWYLANHLGKRFRRDVIKLIEDLEWVSAGLWRGRILGRPLWLVSNSEVPIDIESAPLRMVSEQTVGQTRALADLVATSDELWEAYIPLLGELYPHMRKEFDLMAAKHGRRESDWGILAKNFTQAVTPKELVEGGAVKTIIEKVGVEALLGELNSEQWRELIKHVEAKKMIRD